MTYHIEYKLYDVDRVHSIDVVGKSKAEAHSKAVYDAIPAREGTSPYSAWVVSVTYQNGNYKTFDSFEGKPF